jgi:uncharacterized protein
VTTPEPIGTSPGSAIPRIRGARPAKPSAPPTPPGGPPAPLLPRRPFSGPGPGRPPAGLASPAPLAAQEPTTLNVSGSGFVEVTPDRARISFAVETEAEGAREAGEANARLMDRVITALRGHRGPRPPHRDVGLHSSPPLRPPEGNEPQRIAGYTARNTVQVIVDDVDAVGRLVDTALEAGANRVAGMSFEIRDTEPHRQEALRRAVRHARGEAEVMAEALGMRLGDPITVQGGAETPSAPHAVPGRRGHGHGHGGRAHPGGGRTSAGPSASVTIQYRLHP